MHASLYYEYGMMYDAMHQQQQEQESLPKSGESKML